MGHDVTELWQLFFNFFNETKRNQRLQFFSEPVVKELWPLFIQEQYEEVRQFLHDIRLESDLKDANLYEEW